MIESAITGCAAKRVRSVVDKKRVLKFIMPPKVKRMNKKVVTYI